MSMETEFSQDDRMLKEQMLEQFDVLGFAYGFCLVRRKSDGMEGTLDFYTDDTAAPWVRYYYNFMGA